MENEKKKVLDKLVLYSMTSENITKILDILVYWNKKEIIDFDALMQIWNIAWFDKNKSLKTKWQRLR